MGKLFDLKEWLTVADTVRHLSLIFDEEICEADILRLALDRRLQLSVNFVNHTKALRLKLVSYEETGLEDTVMKLIPDDEKKEIREYLKSQSIYNECFIEKDDDAAVVTIKGVWDLPMIGNERINIEREYQALTNGPEVSLINIEGTFVTKPGPTIYQLQQSYDENEYGQGSTAGLEKIKVYIHRNNIKGRKAQNLLDEYKQQRKLYLEARRAKDRSENFYPAGGLPEDSVLVIRTSALREFEHSLVQEENLQMGHDFSSDSKECDDDRLIQSTYWKSLEKLAQQAVNDYPAWKETQRKIQKSGNLQEWLTINIGANNREAEILKKVLSDYFPELG